MARSRRAVGCAVLGLLAGSSILTAGLQVVPGQQPTFRSGVQLIEADVRVFDRAGRFVTDLTPDDFEVFEDGRPQQIAAMHLFGADGGAIPSQALPPQSWIFFFDTPHLTPGNTFNRARQAVETFIRDGLRDGDLGALVAGGMVLTRGLTSVRPEMLDILKRITPGNTNRMLRRELTQDWPRLTDEDEAIRIARDEREVVRRAVQRACSEDPAQCQIADVSVMEKGRRMATLFHRDTIATLEAIQALGSSLANVPGPKTIVLLTEGFVVQDVEGSLRSAVGHAARSGARIYAIDARGLARGESAVEADFANVQRGSADAVVNGPNSLAADTGGMFIRNENNISRALENVAADAGRYYVLAYQPENVVWDGRYRRIEVRVKRDGVRVRARRGYLALEPARMLRPLTAPSPDHRVPAAPALGKEIPSAALPGSVGSVIALPALPRPSGEAATAESAPVTMRLRPGSGTRIKALSKGEADERSATDLAARGWQAYERGDIETARAVFSEAVGRGQAPPWVHYALGMTQAALNEPAEAIRSWEKVRSAIPDFEPVYMDLADGYAHLGDRTRALEVVRDAAIRWPRSADVKSALGVLLVREGRIDEGVGALDEAASLSPDDPLAHLNVARAYALRFIRGRRYVSSQRRWVGSEDDRQKALAAFQRCVALGGPYARQATEEMHTLDRYR